ncbi:hypothetical protein FRC10_009872 [Ceratobasidium sp. 414]|nr:hypothetical protein FRC10_009872 [Ceratobasidium sp. 414]
MSPAYFPSSPAAIAVAAVAIILPSYWVLSRRQNNDQIPAATVPVAKKNPFAIGDRQLQPPKDDPYTLAEVIQMFTARAALTPYLQAKTAQKDSDFRL